MIAARTCMRKIPTEGPHWLTRANGGPVLRRWIQRTVDRIVSQSNVDTHRASSTAAAACSRSRTPCSRTFVCALVQCEAVLSSIIDILAFSCLRHLTGIEQKNAAQGKEKSSDFGAYSELDLHVDGSRSCVTRHR